MASSGIGDIDLTQAASRLKLEMLRAVVKSERNNSSLGRPKLVALNFLPMAARKGQVQLPEEIRSANDQLLILRFEPDAKGVTIRVQADGFARAAQIRNAWARLFTENGLVDERFRFDAKGDAELRVSKAPEIVESLLSGVMVEYLL
ncbi:MAG: hypothetical protein KTR21_02245 [Rhodobacteraceae bacterium]|nr:hypothetical protein [Paracoccaceae bacterium]